MSKLNYVNSNLSATDFTKSIFSSLALFSHMTDKVIYPKYSKHWPYLLAATIDCGSSKILNCGLNHGLLLLLFKVFLWKHILDWNEISGLKSRMLYCYIVYIDFRFYLMYKLICQKPIHFYLPRCLCRASSFECF